MSILNVAIVGAGKAGAELHIPAYRRVANVEVVAVCDSDLDRARTVARDNEVPSFFPTLDNAMKENRIDLVSICTPPSTHLEISKAAMESGSHVLLEKPMCTNLDQAMQLKRVSQETERKLCVVHNKKYEPGIREAVTRVKEGEIGQVQHVHATWIVEGAGNMMIADPDFWCHELPGGRWEEMIPHPIYNIYQFMGRLKFNHLEMKHVSNTWPWLPADEVDITLEGKSGYANIVLSANAARKFKHMIVYGTEGILFVSNAYTCDLLKIRYLGSIKPLFRTLLRNLFLRRRPQREKYQSGHQAIIQEYVSYILGEEVSPPVSLEEAFNTLELTLEIGSEINRQGKKE